MVRLARDLPAHPGPWTAEEVADLDQQLLVGIEVASSPIPDINALGPTVIAADFGNNNGLLLGPELADLAGVELACLIDGELVGEGTAANLPGGLHHGLATALNLLIQRGHAVRAGTVFATGAITGIHADPARSALSGRGPRSILERRDPSLELRTADLGSQAS